MPGIILVAFLVVCSTEKGSPIPIVEYDKGLRYEEYIVEHEISASQAKNAALAIDLSSGKSWPTITPRDAWHIGPNRWKHGNRSQTGIKNELHAIPVTPFGGDFRRAPNIRYLVTQWSDPTLKLDRKNQQFPTDKISSSMFAFN